MPRSQRLKTSCRTRASSSASSSSRSITPRPGPSPTPATTSSCTTPRARCPSAGGRRCSTSTATRCSARCRPHAPHHDAGPDRLEGRLPLEGMRILDFTVVWAGPYATTLLADWGAEVIRVESRQHWAPNTRGFMAGITREVLSGNPTLASWYPDMDPGTDHWNRAALFNGHGRGKRSMTLDLNRPDAQEQFARLVEMADGLIENNLPDNIEKVGISWEHLSSINPKLVLVSDARIRPHGAVSRLPHAREPHGVARRPPGDPRVPRARPRLRADGGAGRRCLGRRRRARLPARHAAPRAQLVAGCRSRRQPRRTWCRCSASS